MYYLLCTEDMKLNVRFSASNNVCTQFIMGVALDPDYDIQALPFEFEMKVSKDPYTGEDREPTLYDYFSGDSIVSDKFLAILKEHAADCAEFFPAKINCKSPHTEPINYTVMNVTEMLDCALPSEKYNSALADLYENILAIDPEKAEGKAMFRLERCELAVIVNQDIAMAIKEQKLTGVSCLAVCT